MKRVPPEDALGPMRRFTRSPREGAAEPDPLLCRHFRIRGYAPDAARARPGSSPYGCAKTMGATGPDGEPVGLDECQDGRICFEGATLETDS